MKIHKTDELNDPATVSGPPVNTPSQTEGAIPVDRNEPVSQQAGTDADGGQVSNRDGHLEKLLPDDEESDIGLRRVRSDPT